MTLAITKSSKLAPKPTIVIGWCSHRGRDSGGPRGDYHLLLSFSKTHHLNAQNEGGSLRRVRLQFGEGSAEDVESPAGGGERNDNKADFGDYMGE